MADSDRATEAANAVGRELAASHGPDILTVPSVVEHTALGDNEVRLEVVGDVRPRSRWLVEAELRRQLKQRFDGEQLDVALVTAEVA